MSSQLPFKVRAKLNKTLTETIVSITITKIFNIRLYSLRFCTFVTIYLYHTYAN